MQTKTKQIITWSLRLLAALIMIQSLFFKFSASEESVYLFSKIGMEPWGRIGTGIAELIASVLILVPRTTWMGALMAIGVMSGAVFFHLTWLGIEVQGDGGQLFVYALVVLFSSVALLLIERKNVVSFISTQFYTRKMLFISK